MALLLSQRQFLPDAQLMARSDGVGRRGGRTALVEAAMRGRSSCVARLVAHAGAGARAALLLAVDDDGNTPLAYAVAAGHTAVVVELLANSPREQVLLANKRGWTPLMAAAQEGRSDCMRLLLAHAPLDQVLAGDEAGDTALVVAASSGRAPCVALLLRHEPERQVTAVGKDEETPLIAAAIAGHAPCVALLLETCMAAEQVTAKDVNGNTAVMHAAANGRRGCVETLLGVKHRVAEQVKARNHRGLTALHRACESDWPDCARLLLAHGASVSTMIRGARSARTPMRRLDSIVSDLAQMAAVPHSLARARSAGSLDRARYGLIAGAEKACTGVIRAMLGRGALMRMYLGTPVPSAAVIGVIDRIIGDIARDVVLFPDQLNHAIATEIQRMVRPCPPPLPPLSIF